MIKEVHAAINKLANGNFRQWHRLIPLVEFNLRTAPNSATGITPAMALYGRELKKGVLEIPQPVTETALDERHYSKKRQAAQDAMKAISTMLSPVKKPRGKLKGKTYAVGQVVRVHRDPPKDLTYISKWRNPYEEKMIVEVDGRDHYWVRSAKTGKITREYAHRLAPCLYLQTFSLSS